MSQIIGKEITIEMQNANCIPKDNITSHEVIT